MSSCLLQIPPILLLLSHLKVLILIQPINSLPSEEGLFSALEQAYYYSCLLEASFTAFDWVDNSPHRGSTHRAKYIWAFLNTIRQSLAKKYHCKIRFNRNRLYKKKALNICLKFSRPVIQQGSNGQDKMWAYCVEMCLLLISNFMSFCFCLDCII